MAIRRRWVYWRLSPPGFPFPIFEAVTVLGIDVGGSGIKGSLVNVKAGSLTHKRLRLSTPEGARPNDVALSARSIARHFDWDGPIGFAVPFRVKNGVAKTAANVDDSWIGTNARELFTEVTGCPVTVINDADAAGLAEVTFGAARDEPGTVLALTVGTGIGSGLFINRTLVPNVELGHLRMHGSSAEDWAADSCRKQEGLSWEEWADRFQEYLEYVEFLFDPDLIVLGGGVSRPKRTARYLHLLHTQCRLVPAALQNEAGIVGAACAATGL